MDLPSKATRDALGIDTIYRGFLWSALSLHLSLKQVLGVDNQAIRVSTPVYGENSVIRILATLSTNRSNFFDQAMDRWRSVDVFFSGLGSTVTKSSPPTVSPIAPIPADPTTDMDSMERYLAWTATLIQLAYFNASPPQYNTIAYRTLPDTSIDTSQFQTDIDYAVPIDPFVYACTDNIVRSVLEPQPIANCP